jgi:lipoprotein-releasing system permease protein
MNSQSYTNKYTGQKQWTNATCNDIEVKLRDPTQINQVKPQIEKIVNDVLNKYGVAYFIDPVKTQTWEERQADFLNAVEHEEGLLVILFAIISVVAVFLIFCIFFMIVMEKTRDVGILKSVGATSTSIAAIFLSYGLAIGIVGGGLGLLLGWLIIHNINGLHAWLGRVFHVKIWDAKTYLFDTIPNTMDSRDAIIIVSVAILASVLGALVPAIRAARMNPVEALRWE